MPTFLNKVWEHWKVLPHATKGHEMEVKGEAAGEHGNMKICREIQATHG